MDKNQNELGSFSRKIADLNERNGFLGTYIEEVEDDDLQQLFGLKEVIYGYYATIDDINEFHCRIKDCLKDQLIIDKRLMAVTTRLGEYISFNSLGIASEALEILATTNRRVVLCAEHILPALTNPRFIEAPKNFDLKKFRPVRKK